MSGVAQDNERVLESVGDQLHVTQTIPNYHEMAPELVGLRREQLNIDRQCKAMKNIDHEYIIP